MTKYDDKTHPLRIFRHCPICGSGHFTVKNEKSKRCDNCGFVYFFNPSTATVAVIVNELGELLTVRRAKEPTKGTRDLPGGFCDCAETAEEGVMREVKEETGLEVDKCEYLFSVPNIYPYSGLEVHTMDLFFLCHVKNGQIASAMDDAESLEWINCEQILPEEFGLQSIREGVKRLKTLLKDKK